MLNRDISYLFVFDIETIVDTDVAFNLTGLDSTDVNDLRQSITDYHLEVTEGKNSFPRQLFHKVIALSYALVEITSYTTDCSLESYKLKYLRSGDQDNSEVDEKKLVEGFFDAIKKYKPRLVTFNGRTFDIPVLKYRAMKYGISCPSFFAAKSSYESYQYRYNDQKHCDLLDALSDFGASARIKLSEVSAVLGVPGKFGTDGSQVQQMYDEGKLCDIRSYCETDVITTYLVYLRYSLLKGTIGKKQYNDAIEQVLLHIENIQQERLKEYKVTWEKACKGEFFIK